ncbi:hypothetical protein Q1W71_02725 [Flavobacterium pectinovorum]|uniref:hypothetical protein n=1 Tax=Flavobacterium pectinovorum TaxID=29533 RepID=UPI00265DD1A1|nr:hypothetical protein [Flavobacterium pectinovorum]WKL48703.1 hypothetical protein Q1W71_02725 [Flavobacterium pectinovorum]
MFISPKDNKYWIFKLDQSKREFIIDRILSGTNEIELKYEIKTVPKNEIDGKVLFLYQNDLTKNYEFEYEATINKTEVIRTESGPHSFRIVFDQVKKIDKVINLEDVKYSFKNSTNITKSNRYLNLNLNSISKVEFEAVLYGDIFFSRTIFLKLYETLPYEHKLAFYKIIFDLNPYEVKLTNDHELLLLKLENYIENYILNPAKLFVESSEILKKLVDENSYEKIGFNTTRRAIDYLDPQVNYAENFISLYNNDLFDKFKQTYENFKETESEFKKLFKNMPSPVTLT